MRNALLWSLTGAALLALAVPPAAAVYDPDAEPVSEWPAYALAIDLVPCPDRAGACIAVADGNLTDLIPGLKVDLLVRNLANGTAALVVRSGSHMDDGRRTESLALVELVAGQNATLRFDVPGDAMSLTFAADDAAGAETDRLDVELPIYTIQFGEGPADTGVVDEEAPQGNLDDDLPAEDRDADADAKGKPTPFLAPVLALGVLAILVGFWRRA